MYYHVTIYLPTLRLCAYNLPQFEKYHTHATQQRYQTKKYFYHQREHHFYLYMIATLKNHTFHQHRTDEHGPKPHHHYHQEFPQAGLQPDARDRESPRSQMLRLNIMHQLIILFSYSSPHQKFTRNDAIILLTLSTPPWRTPQPKPLPIII